MVVKKLMRKCNYLYRQAKKTGLPKDMRQYGTARSNTVTMLRDAKKAFFNELNTADKKLILGNNEKHNPSS